MLKQWRYATLLGLAVAISLFISACGGGTTTGAGTPTTVTGASAGTPGAYNCVAGSLTVSGSTALLPLVTKVATDYTTKCSGASITVNGGGSGTGRSQVEAGSVGIGNSDVPASATQADLVDHQVAVVIFSVIVNPGTGITNLTTDQLKGIYAGTFTNWNQVGGKDMPIVVVSRPSNSGTRATFQQYILGQNEKISGPASLVNDSTGVVVTSVTQTAGAIGYAATGQVPSGSATIITMNGNAATPANVENNTYTFWNIEHMYTKGQPTALAQALLDYMDSDQGHAEEATQLFVAVGAMQSSAITAHNAVPKPQ